MLVNLAIYLVGLGLVTLGRRLAARRRTARSHAVNLDAAVCQNRRHRRPACTKLAGGAPEGSTTV